MNYQEILEELKWNSCSYAEEDCYNCNVKDKQACSNMCILCKQAAKMMEELKRERDAAIKDLKYLPFTTCKWVNTDRCKNSCLCERYEWRGVQENIGNGEVLNETRET